MNKRGEKIPDYLVQLKYESMSFEKLIANPHSRHEIMIPVIEKLGGKIKGIWFSFGKYDVVAIMTLSDRLSVEALAMASRVTGYVRNFKAVPLLSIDESIEAFNYRALKGTDCELGSIES